MDAWTSGVRLVGRRRCCGTQRLPHAPRLRAHARRGGGKQQDGVARPGSSSLGWSEPVAVVRHRGMPARCPIREHSVCAVAAGIMGNALECKLRLLETAGRCPLPTRNSMMRIIILCSFARNSQERDLWTIPGSGCGESGFRDSGSMKNSPRSPVGIQP